MKQYTAQFEFYNGIEYSFQLEADNKKEAMKKARIIISMPSIDYGYTYSVEEVRNKAYSYYSKRLRKENDELKDLLAGMYNATLGITDEEVIKERRKVEEYLLNTSV
jgi:hypothetical protein